MTDWVNIVDIDGLTYVQADGYGNPLDVDLPESGGTFSGTFDGASYQVLVTPGPNVAPGYTIRETITYQISGDATIWLAYAGSSNDGYASAPSDESGSGTLQVQQAIVEATVGAAGFTADAGPTIVESLIVEIDADHVSVGSPPVDPPTGDVILGLPLLRSGARAIDPGQTGQQQIPPSHTCVIVTPPPPPVDPDAPPVPGAGGDSGAGDPSEYPVCIYRTIPAGTDCYTQTINTPDGPISQTVCSTHGPITIPINAPCR